MRATWPPEFLEPPPPYSAGQGATSGLTSPGDFTQKAERVASFQTHTDVSALLFPAQEQQEPAQEILGFHHCQALKGKQTFTRGAS